MSLSIFLFYFSLLEDGNRFSNSPANYALLSESCVIKLIGDPIFVCFSADYCRKNGENEGMISRRKLVVA